MLCLEELQPSVTTRGMERVSLASPILISFVVMMSSMFYLLFEKNKKNVGAISLF